MSGFGTKHTYTSFFLKKIVISYLFNNTPHSYLITNNRLLYQPCLLFGIPGWNTSTLLLQVRIRERPSFSFPCRSEEKLLLSGHQRCCGTLLESCCDGGTSSGVTRAKSNVWVNQNPKVCFVTKHTYKSLENAELRRRDSAVSNWLYFHKTRNIALQCQEDNFLTGSELVQAIFIRQQFLKSHFLEL